VRNEIKTSKGTGFSCHNRVSLVLEYCRSKEKFDRIILTFKIYIFLPHPIHIINTSTCKLGTWTHGLENLCIMHTRMPLPISHVWTERKCIIWKSYQIKVRRCSRWVRWRDIYNQIIFLWIQESYILLLIIINIVFRGHVCVWI
jgi:hypothetical protein